MPYYCFLLGSERMCSLCKINKPIVEFYTSLSDICLCRECADEIGKVFPPPTKLQVLKSKIMKVWYDLKEGRE